MFYKQQVYNMLQQFFLISGLKSKHRPVEVDCCFVAVW